MQLVLLILCLVIHFGGLPQTGWHQYGYYPSGIGAVLLLVVLILLLTGGFPGPGPAP
jgi:hypothetical protein